MTEEEVAIGILSGEWQRCRTCHLYYKPWLPATTGKRELVHYEWGRASVECWQCVWNDLSGDVGGIKYALNKQLLEDLEVMKP